MRDHTQGASGLSEDRCWHPPGGGGGGGCNVMISLVLVLLSCRALSFGCTHICVTDTDTHTLIFGTSRQIGKDIFDFMNMKLFYPMRHAWHC